MSKVPWDLYENIMKGLILYIYKKLIKKKPSNLWFL